MEKNPFKTNNSKTLDNIPLSQSGILFTDNSTNNLIFNNPIQVNSESGAKVKKLSGYETQIETNPITEQFDPLAQSAHFQNYSYKNNEVIVRPPIIERGNLQQNNFTNTGNFDFLGSIKTETTNQIYENNITDLNYIQSSPLEQYITGEVNNSNDIYNFTKNINFGNETGSNSVKILPTIYADKNNLSDILNQLKDDKDLNYGNNNILYSKPIYKNPQIDNLNPFVDTGQSITENKNLNIDNNILQPTIETENLNILGITSTPINNFQTQNINTDFPLISNQNIDNTLQTNFTLGSSTNVEEYSTNFNIGNDIIQNSSPEEFANIFPLSGKQEGITQAENIGHVTPTSSIDEYIPGKNIVDNNFLLNNVIPKENTVLPNATNIPYDIKNLQLKEEILKPIYINKVINQIPFTENTSYQVNNYDNITNFQNQNLNINQSQTFDINKSQNFNISQSFTFPTQEPKILPTITSNNLPYEITSQNINSISNTYSINPSLNTSNEYQINSDNIDINSGLSADELRKKYRTETEIVPVEETEYIPVKKIKYVKRLKVYVPKVKKVIIPKKIVVPIKKTIYVTKPQNNNIYSPSDTTITLPTRTFYNNNTSINYTPSNNITYNNTSYQLPYSPNSNPLPYTTSSYQLPYTTSSYQLPYTTNSNQLPYNTKSYSSNTEYDNDIVEHAIPLDEKGIESKIEEIRPIRYMSPVRSKSKYIPQSPNVSFNYSLNQNTHNSRFQSPLRKSYVFTGNLYTPRTYMARSLSSRK